ncbi:MAG: TolC family protein [Pseudohongiellaceae bacterium]
MNRLSSVRLALAMAMALSVPLPALAADADSGVSGNSSEAMRTGQGRTLEDFFTAAMEHSPRLRIAEDQMDIGSARRRAANGQLLPQLSANASASDNRQERSDTQQVQNYRGERYSLQLRQVLFNWRAFASRSAAYARENQYEALYYEELATLFADVAERYFNVLEARDTLASVEAELRAVQNQRDQVNRLRDLQMVPITDLYDVEARLSALEAERVAARSEVDITREALRSAAGLGVGELYSLGEAADLSVPEGTAADWAERARRANHQISAREFAVDAAGKRVSESRGAYMPEVSIVAQQQRSDLGYDNQSTPRRDTTYVGVDVSVPLFAGGSNRASVSEALSQQSIARNELRQTQLEVGDQARMLYLRLQANSQRVTAAKQMVESMALAVESRQRSFELGNTTSVEVLDALRDQFRAERELQAYRYEHIKLSLQLQQAAGDLDAEDMLEVSGWLEPAENGDGAAQP